ncbi:MAG: hypothetical protein GY854_32140 [Deltaproteobacteria bacterium]|nr:hypothetical protein [Deltaproteobacteria bacterium]
MHSVRSPDNEHTVSKWRCDNCGVLLGVNRDGRFHLKYKSAQYIVCGSVMAVCPRCSQFNEMAVCKCARKETVTQLKPCD